MKFATGAFAWSATSPAVRPASFPRSTACPAPSKSGSKRFLPRLWRFGVAGEWIGAPRGVSVAQAP